MKKSISGKKKVDKTRLINQRNMKFNDHYLTMVRCLMSHKKCSSKSQQKSTLHSLLEGEQSTKEKNLNKIRCFISASVTAVINKYMNHHILILSAVAYYVLDNMVY